MREMQHNYKILYLDIDENFYIENDIVKVKTNKRDDSEIADRPIDDIWDNVKRIIMRAKEYDESNSSIECMGNKKLS